MKHAVIIRMKYQADYEHIEKRLRLFEDHVLPCFLSQSDQEFDLWILVDEAYRARVDAMSSKIKTYSGDMISITKGIKDHQMPQLAPPVMDYEIQTRHDCDDLCCQHYIEKIKAECNGSGVKLISFRPFIYDLASGDRYLMKGKQYDSTKCSMFLSLYQPDASRRRDFIYNYNHIHISKVFPDVVTIPEGYCDMVIHDTNVSNSLRLCGAKVPA